MTKWAEGQNRILKSRRIGVRDGYEGRPQQPPQQVVLGSLAERAYLYGYAEGQRARRATDQTVQVSQ